VTLRAYVLTRPRRTTINCERTANLYAAQTADISLLQSPRANILAIAECMRLRPHTLAAPGRIDALARWQGLHEYATHRVPVGAMILDAKYCEMCGCNFLRRGRSKDRYCSKCLLTIPTLNAQKAEKFVSELIQ